jgi:hypothetical protein
MCIFTCVQEIFQIYIYTIYIYIFIFPIFTETISFLGLVKCSPNVIILTFIRMSLQTPHKLSIAQEVE